VILRPSFALTLTEVRDRIKGGRISGDSTLILDGDIRLDNVNVDAGAALVVHSAPGASVTIKDATFSAKSTFEIQALTDTEITSSDEPEFLRIRGYRIIDQGAKIFTITEPGKWIITPQGEVHAA
jgi:UDP-sugar pyrophosphorylase